MSDSDENRYTSHLRDVYNSCASSPGANIGKNQVRTLCQLLTIGDKADDFINKLFQRNVDSIGFEEFKESLVTVLAESPVFPDEDGLSSDGGGPIQTSTNVSSDEQISPKLIRGARRYGRRSKPDTTTGAAEFTDDLAAVAAGAAVGAVAVDMLVPAELQGSNDVTTAAVTGLPMHVVADTFEGSGEVAPSPTLWLEKQSLQNIWRELGVGADGFLDMHELSLVCSHIGMDDMDDRELRQLFERLDADMDGRVSFTEFLRGLSLHGTPTPATGMSTPPVRPSSLKQASGQGSMTSIHSGSPPPQLPTAKLSHCGIFSELDQPHGGPMGGVGQPPTPPSTQQALQTGVATSEALLAYWTKLGLSEDDGLKVLEELELDGLPTISLSDLTFRLDENLLSHLPAVSRQTAPSGPAQPPESNSPNHQLNDAASIVYSAAVLSYQHEARRMSSLVERISAESAHLRSELTERAIRNSLLIREVEERHANLERANEAKIRRLIENHETEVRQLEAEHKSETDALKIQLSTERAKSDERMELLRCDYQTVRDSEQQFSRERDQLHSELLRTGERLVELERLNIRLQEELENAAEQQKNAQHLVATRQSAADEQLQFSKQRMTRLDAENKELKDKVDELQTELEANKQQLRSGSSGGRVARRTSSRTGGSRTGSLLSKYAKPKVERHRLSGAGEEGDIESSEDDDLALPNVDVTPTEVEALKAKITELTEREQQLKDQLDRAETEHAEKVEKMLEEFNIEKETAASEIRHNTANEIRSSMQEAFDTEKVSLESQCLRDIQLAKDQSEVELNLLREQHDITLKEARDVAEEKVAAFEKLREDLEADFEQKVIDETNAITEQERLKFERELEQRLLEQEEEMQDQFATERLDFLEEVETERQRLITECDRRVADLESVISLEGESGLRGKLKEDFYRLLQMRQATTEGEQIERILAEQRQTEEAFLTEKAALREQLNSERLQLEETFQQHISSLLERQEMEQLSAETRIKEELETQFLDELAEMKTRHGEVTDRLASDKRALQRQLDIQREEFEAETARLRVELTDGGGDATLMHETLRGNIDRLEEQNLKLLEDLSRAQIQLDESEIKLSAAEARLVEARADLERERDEARAAVEMAERRAGERHVWEDSLAEWQEKWETERQQLNDKLKDTTEKLANANASVSLIESKAQREIGQMQASVRAAIPHEKYDAEVSKVVDLQQKVRELEEVVTGQTRTSDKLISEMREQYEDSKRSVEAEMKSLRNQLSRSRDSANRLQRDYNSYLEKGSNAGGLCKELYIENCQLMQALQITEQRQKTAEREMRDWQEECRLLNALLAEVSLVQAIG